MSVSGFDDTAELLCVLLSSYQHYDVIVLRHTATIVKFIALISWDKSIFGNLFLIILAFTERFS